MSDDAIAETAPLPALRLCATCGEPTHPEDNWCEACGADLDTPGAVAEAPAEPAYVPAGPCVSCGADMAEITEDGWCQMCGTKQPAPGDHVVDNQGIVAVVSDRGRKHGVNEDAGAIGVSENLARTVLVVCDGVSSTDRSEQASQVAATAAVEVLVADSDSTTGTQLVAAAAAGQQVVVDATPPGALVPPSCTFVAAVADTDGEKTTVTVGWLGDSRAYWLDDTEARQLTRDHLWANEQRVLGQLSDAEIDADPRAHSITRWLGADAIDVTPEIVELTVDTPGLLLVCSDGLWNYAPEPADLHALVAGYDVDDISLVDLAERLVAFANEAGGHDNITVALTRFPQPAGLPASPTEPEGSAETTEQTESNEPEGFAETTGS